MIHMIYYNHKERESDEMKQDFIEIGFNKDIIDKMTDEEIEKMCTYKDADDLEKYYQRMQEKYEEGKDD